MAKQVALIQSTANNSFPRGINFLTVVALDTLSTTADSHGLTFEARVNYYADYLTNEEKAHVTVRAVPFVRFALEKLNVSVELADKRNTQCEACTLAQLPEFASVRELRNYLCNAVTNVKTFTFYKTKVAALEKVFGILAQVATEAERKAKEEGDTKFAKYDVVTNSFKLNTERHAICFAAQYIHNIAQGAETWGKHTSGFSPLDTELGAAVCSTLARPYEYRPNTSTSSWAYEMLRGAYGDTNHYGDGYCAMVRTYMCALNSANCSVQDYRAYSGVYTQAADSLHDAFKAAGLNPTEHWRDLVIIENELIERVAARIADAAACYGQVETFDRAVTEAPIAIGRILAAGYGDDLTPYLDPEYLRGRFGKTEAQVETIAIEAKDEAELVAALENIVAAQDGAQVETEAQTEAQADAPEAEPAQASAAPEAAQDTQDTEAELSVKPIARAVAQAVAAMGASGSQIDKGGAQADNHNEDASEGEAFALEPMYLEPEQGWLELSFEGEGATGEAEGAAAPAPAAAELDWAEVDASDGFVYDPDDGLEFFTIEDAERARAQGTLERDGEGESYGYLPVYGDALESVLEASTLTPEELAARCAAAGAAVVPLVGAAAKARKETAVSAEPSGDDCGLMGGGRVLIIGSNAHNKGVHEAAYVDREAAARSAANPPKAKREKSALNDYQVLDHIPEKPAAKPEVQDALLSRTWFYFDRGSRLVTSAEPFTPCLKADVLKRLERVGLFPALCDSSTDKEVLKAAWLALLTRPSVHLDAKQLTAAQAAYDKAKALALDVVTGLNVLQGSMDTLSRTYISEYDSGRQRIFATLLGAFQKAAPEFVALRTQMLTPLVAGYMCRFYMYQEAAGRADERLRDLSLVPLLAAAIAQGVSSTVCFIFAQGFSSACFPILNAACKDAYEELKASGQFCLSSEQSRKYCDIVAGRIAYMLLWPFTQQLCDHACDSPAEGFVQPVAQLMRCANPNMRLNNDGIDAYNILAGICCEQAYQCLTKLNPDGHELTPDELQTLKAQVVATTCAVMQGTHEKSHGLTGSSLSLTGFGDMLSCWRPSFCYHSEHVNQSFDMTFGPEESVQCSACLYIGRKFDQFVVAVTEDKKLTWAQLPELTIQCQAFVDGINAQYPELIKARNKAFRAHLWALVQQLLMASYWRLELVQVSKMFNELYLLDCGIFDSDFSKQLAWVILRGYAQDKKHDVRPLNHNDFAINLAALKNCFCFGFHRDSWGFEVMTYFPREAVYDYFNPFSYWPGALDQSFSRVVLSHYNEMLRFERRLFEPKTGGQVDMEG